MIHQNVLQSIGRTPLVRINQVGLDHRNHSIIYAKVEGTNPTGSIKDRIALKMIEQAENEGLLDKSKIIIEPTSGNTGISLAMICAVKGYRAEIVMSAAVSLERRMMIEAFGAKITLTDKDLGTDGAINKAKELVSQNPNTYFMPNQFSNQYNKIAHYRTTAEEIWKDTNGTITHFVSAVGTSGTIMGVGKALKENNPKIQIIEAHPEKGHYIQGLKNMEEAIIPELYDTSLIDESIMIESDLAIKMAREIISKEGIFVGMSSGAAMIAAIETSKKNDHATIVVIFPDRGEKYLSTEMFQTKGSSISDFIGR